MQERIRNCVLQIIAESVGTRGEGAYFIDVTVKGVSGTGKLKFSLMLMMVFEFISVLILAEGSGSGLRVMMSFWSWLVKILILLFLLPVLGSRLFCRGSIYGISGNL